jgi:hypothetical protein
MYGVFVGSGGFVWLLLFEFWAETLTPPHTTRAAAIKKG